MKRKLIAYKINGVNEIDNSFFHFLTEDNTKKEDNEVSQIFEHNDKIFSPRVFMIHGKNATGKTHLLNFLLTIDKFADFNSMNPQFAFEFNFFNTFDKKIKLESFYAIEKWIFKQEITFNVVPATFQLNQQGVNKLYKMNKDKEKITYVEISKKDYTGDVIKYMDDNKLWNELSNKLESSHLEPNNLNSSSYPVFSGAVLDFLIGNEIVKNGLDYSEAEFDELKGIEIKRIQSELDEIKNSYVNEFSKFTNIVIPESQLPKNLFDRVITDEELNFKPFIKLFDKNIKDIVFDPITAIYTIKYSNNRRIVRSTTLTEFVSSGTLRGMAMLAIFSEALKRGEDILIDEIESNLNHKIIKFFMDIILDPELNVKNSRIIFSTHYLRTLDYIKRRDSILITSWDEGKQKITKLSNVEELSEIKKRKADYSNSKLIDRIYSFDLEPTYEDFINFKKDLLNE